PYNPFEVGHVDSKDDTYDVFVSGNYVYMAENDSGLRVFDISSPANPVEVGFCSTGDKAAGVYVSGDKVYIADSGDGLYILRNDLLTGINDHQKFSLPASISQNYPNPFIHFTTISYELNKKGSVQLVIYDGSGRYVRTLVNKTQSSGEYAIIWDGKDNSGNHVISGVYFYTLTFDETILSSRRMVLVR
ncbi:MAG: T9SS type A sorting domain-containing protein, partial [Bacteroidales bacterium]|nr:T9SS type A sorting domain-containing protein [Bacteroidales bacterium]